MEAEAGAEPQAPRDRGDGMGLRNRYEQVRSFSVDIAAPLSPEDCAMQTMPDVSPTRWHLAHTTWFFETFVLKQQQGYRAFDDAFEYLFNSYYNTVGEQFPRNRRGTLSRPGLPATLDYRKHVDEAMLQLLENEVSPALAEVVELGLQHEQQHQELMWTDIKHVLFSNPLFPAYFPGDSWEGASGRQESVGVVDLPERSWQQRDAGLDQVGFSGEHFCFDNECPRHTTYLQDHAIASTCVTNGEYLEFVAGGGYRDARHWLSMGWQYVQDQQWSAPLYWLHRNGEWFEFTLGGLQPLELERPLTHVSFFEAEAFARWAGARLPTEFEWEKYAEFQGELECACVSNRLRRAGAIIHPQLDTRNPLGNLWEWTSSAYLPYPGFDPPQGALGEYNGKFMCNQFVLRGGSCATSEGHLRCTYRNFFPPEARWQFSGIRLAH